MYLSSLLFSLAILVNSPTSDEIWYVWMDTMVTVDGKEIRIVGDQPFVITCCVKSGKYSRLEKSASKWIRQNYDSEYEQTSPLKKIQDMSLAIEIVEKAVSQSTSDNSIKIVGYTDICN